MLYQALRATASIALRWYYSHIDVQGEARIPRVGPLVVISNHPNALIDPLLVGTALPRRVLLTAKATLFEGPALAWLFRAVGVVPLRRAKDEQARGTPAAPLRERNVDTFHLVTSALKEGNAVLVFPEGISHDGSTIAPLKSGTARMAAQARAKGTRGLRILPMGLIFEAKEQPESRVLVRIGDPLDLDAWVGASDEVNVAALTRELEARLRRVTLNFATAERGARAVRVARALAELATTPPVEMPRSLHAEADLALRVDSATTALERATPETVAAADALLARLAALERELGCRGVSLADIRISVRLHHGARFAIREGLLALVAIPVAVLGRFTHWIPLRIGRMLALASLRDDGSLDQPAMRTILFGLASVIAWYVSLAAVLTYWQGPLVAALCLVLIFSAAHVDRLLRGRLRRAVRRARAFVAIRADPSFQRRMIASIDELLAEALLLEHALTEHGAPTVI